MASKKQIEYLTKLSNWKNQKLPKNVEEMSQAEASALIDEWKQLKSVGSDPAAQQEQTKLDKEEAADRIHKQVRPYNKFQAGMAKNAVAAAKDVEWIASNPEAFAELVQGVYEAMELADDILHRMHPGGDYQ